MIHLLFDRRPWFSAKRYGYGAGLPIAWQGWLILALHMLVMIGLAVLLRDRPVALVIGVTLAALAPLPIYAARTEGGWRWRWDGER